MLEDSAGLEATRSWRCLGLGVTCSLSLTSQEDEGEPADTGGPGGRDTTERGVPEAETEEFKEDSYLWCQMLQRR